MPFLSTVIAHFVSVAVVFTTIIVQLSVSTSTASWLRVWEILALLTAFILAVATNALESTFALSKI